MQTIWSTECYLRLQVRMQRLWETCSETMRRWFPGNWLDLSPSSRQRTVNRSKAQIAWVNMGMTWRRVTQLDTWSISVFLAPARMSTRSEASCAPSSSWKGVPGTRSCRSFSTGRNIRKLMYSLSTRTTGCCTGGWEEGHCGWCGDGCAICSGSRRTREERPNRGYDGKRG